MIYADHNYNGNSADAALALMRVVMAILAELM